MKLEEKLACLRKRQGLTQLELAEEISMSRQAVSKWEVGAAVPSTEKLILLGRMYGISLDVLVNDDLDLPDEPQPSGALAAQEETHEEIHTQPERGGKRRPLWKRVTAAAFALLIVFSIGVWVGMRLLSNRPAEDNILPIEALESETIDISSAEYFSMFP